MLTCVRRWCLRRADILTCVRRLCLRRADLLTCVRLLCLRRTGMLTCVRLLFLRGADMLTCARRWCLRRADMLTCVRGGLDGWYPIMRGSERMISWHRWVRKDDILSWGDFGVGSGWTIFSHEGVRMYDFLPWGGQDGWYPPMSGSGWMKSSHEGGQDGRYPPMRWAGWMLSSHERVRMDEILPWGGGGSWKDDILPWRDLGEGIGMDDILPRGGQDQWPPLLEDTQQNTQRMWVHFCFREFFKLSNCGFQSSLHILTFCVWLIHW